MHHGYIPSLLVPSWMSNCWEADDHPSKNVEERLCFLMRNRAKLLLSSENIIFFYICKEKSFFTLNNQSLKFSIEK